MSLRHRKTAGLLVGAVGVTAALVVAGPAGTGNASSCGYDGRVCSAGLHLGVATPGLPADTRAMAAFTSALGVKPDIALSFTSFKYPLNAAGLKGVAAAGQLPMVTLEPFDPDAPGVDRYPLASIASGAFDSYLTAQAAVVKSVGAPVAIRFAHEMNAVWYPWGSTVNGNTPAQYVAAYRHVHDVFTAAGATDVTWVWSPALKDGGTAPGDLGKLYPGDAYVDWVGISAYFDQQSDTFATTVAPTLAQLDKVAPSKPVYVAEGAVLPGPRRAAMIHDLVGGLVASPRVIGLTWFDFDIAARQDWRLDTDAAGLAALREEIGTGWFATAATGATPAPLLQVAPLVGGPARVGAVLTATHGTWRTVPDTTVTARWLRCTDPLSCVPTGQTSTTYTVTDADLGQTLRYEVTASSAGGAFTALSVPTAAVLAVPTVPAPPVVQARDGALRVTFPAPPRGTTGWLLTVDGKAKPVVPVAAPELWLTGLTNGRPVSLSLAAVTASTAESLTSVATSGTAVPLPAPFTPYVVVSGRTATLTLPKVPVGATGWVLTADGVARTVTTATKTVTLSDLEVGVVHRWSLVATSGSWAGSDGATSVAVTGAFTPLATPAAPAVVAGQGSVTLALPALPTGATGWRVTVGPTTFPDVAAGTRTFIASGLRSGYAVTWTLKAVGGNASSTAASGRATP